MSTRAAWVRNAPWDLTYPLDQPLSKYDIMAHRGVPPHRTEHHSTYTVTVATEMRCALAYLIPQTGMTSRLILAWAFKAPLVLLDEVAMTVPLTDLVGVADDYHPEYEVVVSERKFSRLPIPACGLFEDGHPQKRMRLAGEPCCVRRIYWREVAIAPLDTPVHAFSHDLIGFPGN